MGVDFLMRILGHVICGVVLLIKLMNDPSDSRDAGVCLLQGNAGMMALINLEKQTKKSLGSLS